VPPQEHLSVQEGHVDERLVLLSLFQRHRDAIPKHSPTWTLLIAETPSGTSGEEKSSHRSGAERLNKHTVILAESDVHNHVS
jgi:hypothetical protein